MAVGVWINYNGLKSVLTVGAGYLYQYHIETFKIEILFKVSIVVFDDLSKQLIFVCKLFVLETFLQYRSKIHANTSG